MLENSSPRRFAFYFGIPDDHQSVLSGKKAGEARAIAGFVEIEVEDVRVLISDGVNIRYYAAGETVPPKHQLYVEFDDGSSLVCTVQMYGGLWAYREGENDNKYYLTAKEKPSPLTDEFDESYFWRLLDSAKQSISVKAFLATEQRIPGLGNGVLQDILFQARVNTRRPLGKLSGQERANLFTSTKLTLAKMTAEGGRDTEKDIFGHPGGYQTIMCSKNLGKPCPACGAPIVKQAYMGGNVYFCPRCQPVDA